LFTGDENEDEERFCCDRCGNHPHDWNIRYRSRNHTSSYGAYDAASSYAV
jgi:hypothetical protein